MVKSRVIKFIPIIAKLVVLATILSPGNLDNLTWRAADGPAVSLTYEPGCRLINIRLIRDMAQTIN